jgi:hypothetical protein
MPQTLEAQAAVAAIQEAVADFPVRRAQPDKALRGAMGLAVAINPAVVAAEQVL